MSIRSYPLLKEKVVQILEEYHYLDSNNEGKHFNRKICSKHWWFNFMLKNLEIKQLWQSLPLRRGVNHIKINPILISDLNKIEEEEDDDEGNDSEVEGSLELCQSPLSNKEFKDKSLSYSNETTYESQDFPSPCVRIKEVLCFDESNSIEFDEAE